VSTLVFMMRQGGTIVLWINTYLNMVDRTLNLVSWYIQSRAKPIPGLDHVVRRQ
jgi:hypothetical protein